MDPWAFRLANRLLDQSERKAGLELGPGGLVLRVEAEHVRIALAGAERPVAVDGRPIPWWSAIGAVRGQRIEIGPARRGVWSYLAVRGGLAVGPVLGSCATHTLTRLGGLEGRPLRAGDRLPLADPGAGPDLPDLAMAEPPVEAGGPIRIVLGPQEAWFSEAGIATLLGAAWRVSPRSDRMGYRLEGPRIEHARSPNIVSDGIVMGAIQVPGSGQPIVLMADRQSTGGYPKIATVIGADLGRLAQVPAGGTLRFAAVDLATARAARRLARQRLEAALATFAPIGPGGALEPCFLLSVNLVSGVTAGEP
jgi:biotin-dependent carboxylase-like uncharacterized protein